MLCLRMPTLNKGYTIAAILLFVIELVIALYFHDEFIRPYFGDFLVIILLYCTVKAVVNLPVITTALGVLVFAYLIEILQYFDIVHRIGLGGSAVATTVIGTTFQWGDIVAYTLGTIAIMLIERFRNARA
ncbi:MAG: hypothetical protein K0S09_442 [Sphingobacteriaceae bacterium]|nr:hypothetical protein [Sphingobacteriaceae bacterium]